MIKTIRIKRYQAIDDVSIDLGKFTVLVGESGVGKSAFIRAIEKMVNNQAVCGSDWTHLPTAARNTFVSIKMDDGDYVAWVKGLKDNVYFVNDVELKKVGRGCPEEIFNVLKIGDKYNLNFDKQFDLPFLCSDNGQLVAKILGEITNVNMLIAANKEANREKINLNRTLSIREGDLISLKADLSKYDNHASKAKYLEVLKSLQDNLVVMFGQYEKLKSLKLQMNDSLEKIRSLSQVLNNTGNVVNNAVDALNILSNKVSRFNYLEEKSFLISALSVKIKGVNFKVNEYSFLEKYDNKLLLDKIKQYKDLAKLIGGLDRNISVMRIVENELNKLSFIDNIKLPIVDQYEKLRNLKSLLANHDNKLYISSAQVETSEKKLSTLKSFFKSFIEDNPMCPLCGNTLEKEG